MKYRFNVSYDLFLRLISTYPLVTTANRPIIVSITELFLFSLVLGNCLSGPLDDS